MYHRYCAAPPPLGLKVVCSPAPLAAAVMSAPQPRESETAFVSADKEEEEERRTGEGEDEEKAFSSESDQLIPHGTSTEREGEELASRTLTTRTALTYAMRVICTVARPLRDSYSRVGRSRADFVLVRCAFALRY